jgi:aryl-alcohol dehydrogenase-like predicted oxidoreductase
MQLMQLGLNGPKIAALGVGCWAWGDWLYWGYGSGYNKADLRAAFQSSLAENITLFDTAEIYGFGASEKLLGEFAAESRAEIIVASKLFPVVPWRVSSRQLLGVLRASLRRLGLPNIQLYQMHWPLSLVNIESWMHAMADAVEAGLIKQVGISNYSPHDTERAYKTLQSRGLHLASNQVRYSLLDRSIERSGLLNLCKELGVTVIAYSPIAQGLLTGKYSAATPPPPKRRISMRSVQRVQPLVDELARLGAAHSGKTQAQVALNWCITKGTLPIPGAKNAKQAGENAGALGWDLDAGELLRLDELAETAEE